MAFRRNEADQLGLYDSYAALTPREKKFLARSWAAAFAARVFPRIDEERYAPLYADGRTGRPHNPVNVMVGLLLLKELTGFSDEELFESLLFDERFRYALHTTSMREQPVSKSGLGKFRRLLRGYEKRTGRDLLAEEREALRAELAALTGLPKGRSARLEPHRAKNRGLL